MAPYAKVNESLPARPIATNVATVACTTAGPCIVTPRSMREKVPNLDEHARFDEVDEFRLFPSRSSI